MINHTQSHLAYLKKEKMQRWSIHAIRLGILVGFIILWELLAYFNIIDVFIMSCPSRIVETLFDLASGGELFFHIGVTTAETLIGFAIATVVGTFFGFLNWWSSKLKKISEPYLVVLNSLPKIALGPILIIWFGAGYNSIIAMTVLICVIITIITVQNAFLAVPQEQISMMQGMGASRLTIFRKLIFQASLPTTISMLKINVGLSFVGSIMGEYLVSKAGIGFLIVYGSQIFDLDLVMTCTVILLILAGLIYYGVSLLEKFSIRYKG